MRHATRAVFVLTLLVLSALAAERAEAHGPSGTLVGVRAGSYTDREDAFVGVELLSRIGNHLYFNPNLEYVFVENGTFGTLNFDVHLDLPTSGNLYLWVGGGAALVHSNPPGPGSDTSVKGNILAGLGFRSGGVIPYFQVKLITTEDRELVVAIGLRF